MKQQNVHKRKPMKTIGEQWHADVVRRRRADAAWALLALITTLAIITGFAVYISFFVVR